MQEQSTQSKYIRRSYHGRARHWQVALACMALICLIVSPIYAASFDCKKAATEMEKTICSDSKLSALDEDLAKVYGEIKSQLKGDAEALSQLTKSQREWLAALKQQKTGTAACTANKECLTISYQKRIKELQDKLSLALKKAPSGSGEEKKYPPYPDVWEREFPDYLPNNALFVPTNTGEVIVGSSFKVDRNGEAVQDDKGNLIHSKGVFAFFENALVLQPYEKFNIEKGEWAYGKKPDYYKETHSCDTFNFKSRDIPGAGDSKINWVKGLAVDRYNKYGSASFKKEEIDGILIDSQRFYTGDRSFEFVQHTMYYNKPVILEKKDEQGKVLWQKVYLYFHPWWASFLSEGVDAYSFFYFKKGCITAIDEDRMFLHFGGTKKIFRLDKDGNPRTNDKNLFVMDYKDYRAMLAGVVSTIDAVSKDLFKSGNYIEPCGIAIGEGENFYNIEDYDFFGAQLSQRFGIDASSKEVRQIMAEIKGLDKCMKNYDKLKIIRRGN